MWVFVAVFVVCANVACVKILPQDQKLTVKIPNDNWVRILFETKGLASKSIDEITEVAELPKLRTVSVPDGDLETRIWIGFGLNGVDGFVLRRSANEWSALHLHGMGEVPPDEITKETLSTPKSGWEKAWQRLTDAGVVVLPDATEAGCRTYIKDGTSYVVEINMNRTYRTYMYDNPNHARCEDAKRMLLVGEIVAEEFSLNEFRIND